jgi:hypothetical protein
MEIDKLKSEYKNLSLIKYKYRYIDININMIEVL